MLLSGLAAAHADADIQRRSLQITTKAGEAVTFRFTLDPVITFSGTDLVLTDINDDSVSMPMAQIASMTFVGDMTSVATVGSDAVTFSLAGGLLSAEGLKAGSTLTIHDMKGALLLSVSADENGRAEAAVGNLAKGVYAVSAAGHSFKFIK